MNTEIELKLLIDSSDISLLQQHPLLKSACPSGPQSEILHSIYYDTSNLDLTQQKMAMRVRRAGTQWIQTVKGGGKVEGGLHQRQEWEVPVASSSPDFVQLENSPWRSVFSPDIQDRLIPIFVTEFERTTWMLELENGVVELALDIGKVQAKQEHVPICEVELELKSGDPASLFAVAKVLQETIHLTPENQSKADRGYMLYRRQI